MYLINMDDKTSSNIEDGVSSEFSECINADSAELLNKNSGFDDSNCSNSGAVFIPNKELFSNCNEGTVKEVMDRQQKLKKVKDKKISKIPVRHIKLTSAVLGIQTAAANGKESLNPVEQPSIEGQAIQVEMPGNNLSESMDLERIGNSCDNKNFNDAKNCSNNKHSENEKSRSKVVKTCETYCNDAVYSATNPTSGSEIDGKELAADELVNIEGTMGENGRSDGCNNELVESIQNSENNVKNRDDCTEHKKLCENNPGQITIDLMMSENATTSPAMMVGHIVENGMELRSLNHPRQVLASILEETILEAPEEFRENAANDVNDSISDINADKLVHVVDTTSIKKDNVNENKKELVHHDHDNKHPPETGDTSQHTSDKDKRIRGSAIDVLTINKNSNNSEQEEQIENINNRLEGSTVSVGSGGDQCIWSTTTSTSERNKDLIRAQGDNDHGMVVTNNNQHVGFTTPADCATPSMNKENNNEIKEVPINMPSSSTTSGTATVETIATVAGDKAEAAETAVGENELCANRQQQPLPSSLKEESIENGVEQCAQASGCSRVSTATVSCVGLEPERSTSCINPSNSCITTSSTNKELDSSEKENYSNNNPLQVQEEKQLCWRFKNGRLVFETVKSKSGLGEQQSEQEQQQEQKEQPTEEHADQSSAADKVLTVLSEQVVASDNSDKEVEDVLHSRDLNKRSDDSRSRLKYLEQKLKEAGITDTKSESSDNNSEPKTSFNKHNYDANQNILQNKGQLEELIPDIGDNEAIETESVDLVDFAKSSNLCQFDVRQIILSDITPAYYEVYDEFNDHESDDDDYDDYNEVAECNNLIMRGGENDTMGADGEQQQRAKQHNPDRDNLKSLLKKPGRSRERKNSNRVVFNENKNEFFDADYIILIREECDYDDEDDDGVCTCNQHEMVRLTCCEPNCSCGGGGGGGGAYDSGFDQTPQSPKFAPPIEFVDAVTLSPPEGYKDMELGEQQLLALQQMARRGQRAPVCRECSATHDDEDDDDSLSDTEIVECGECEEQEEKEKTDQSQQTTPTTPPNDCETITMTTVKEHRILREVPSHQTGGEDVKSSNLNQNMLAASTCSNGSPISGILKGGRLWKQQSLDTGGSARPPDPQQQQSTSESSITSDEESGARRSVRFIESDNKRDVCDGAAEDDKEQNDNNSDEEENKLVAPEQEQLAKPKDNCNMSTSPEATEMMLTFKLGNHVLISNNSLKPNSAVRQLFPCTKPLTATSSGKEDESIHQYLVTAESLKAFEEAKRSKLPQIIQSGDTDESIKRAIERNTLRRSLIRYEPRAKKNVQKTDNSLVERIKQLTCDVDEQDVTDTAEARASPPGEEARNSPEMNSISVKNNAADKSFSPSSSSTTSSNSSSMSSTYKKITDLFGKREKLPDIQQNNNTEGNKLAQTLPDIGGPHHHHHHHHLDDPHKIVTTNDSRRQFLSTLAPLTACVGGGMANNDDYYYHMNNQMAVTAPANIATSHVVAERASVASSVGTEYSLEDIDEGLKNGGNEDPKRIAPDVIAGTPSASESGDELAMFVQQDASRIERIKKKYQPDHQANKDEDDEHDDYGFNRRPSVRGIKPRFGSTTEILQQIQNQLLPPTSSQPSQTARITWPYYSESGLSGVDNKTRNVNQQQQPQQNQYTYPNLPEDVKTRGYGTTQFRPTSLQDESMYQNCANQRCVSRELYRTNINTYSVRVGADYYQSLPRRNSGRPQSPPPLEMSKAYHQTMVYIPYNHIENYQPQHPGQNPYYQMQSSDYVRVSNQNQINKRYVEPIYQQRIPMDESSHYSCLPPPLPPAKQIIRMPMPNGQNSHIVTSRSESPLPGQYATARSTQTLPSANVTACNYYRYRPIVAPVWQGEGNYVTKMNRHSFPAANNIGGTSGARYPQGDNISLTDTESQSSTQINMSNGYQRQNDFSAQKDSMPNSPTKPRFIERGVPEGAASVSPQDVSVNNANNSTMTSPSSPQNPSTQAAPPNQAKPLFYAMNV